MYHLTLIHGTFAPNAAWIQADSDFEKVMRNYLPNSTFEKFDWPGANSHRERLDQGDLLAKQLKKTFDLYPEREHVLIAHSHGGNIVLYALKKLGQVPHNLKFVALSTPFINCRFNGFEAGQTIIKWLLTISVFVISFFAINAKFHLHVAEEQWENHDPGWGSVILLGICYVIAWFVHHYLGKLLNALDQNATAFYDKLKLTAIPPIQILVVSIRGDEALAWLNSAIKPSQWLNFFVSSGWKFSVFALIGIFGISSFGILAATALELLKVPVDTFSIYSESRQFSDSTIFIPAYGITYSIFLLLLIIPATIIFRANPGVFGWESIGSTFSMDIYPTRDLPEGISNQKSIFHDRSIKEGKGLLHSQPYGNETIIEEIGMWIADHG